MARKIRKQCMDLARLIRYRRGAFGALGIGQQCNG
jgi:hypothetical protein